MFFFTFINANVQFNKKQLTLKCYITAKALQTIKQVKLIDKEKFAKTTLNENFKTFVIDIRALKTSIARLSIQLDKKAEIISLFT